MNLYKEEFIHYSQKDSEEGITKYFLAESNAKAYEEVYKWSPTYVDCAIEDAEDGDEEVDELRAIQEVIEAKGEMNMEDIELNDLYYGLTHKGWSLQKEDITEDEISVLKTLGILSKN